MNGHTSPPPDVLVINGTEPPTVPKTLKTVLGASTPSGLRAEATSSTQPKGIAGVLVEASGQTWSLYAAMKQGLLPTGLGLALLEAQAATGGLVDPTQGQLFPVSEALQQGLVGLELKEKLLVAECAVTGYPDPYGCGRLALFQAIGKQVVDRARGWSWLEAQLATGGLIDPVQGMRVAPELACQQGLLDQEVWQGLAERRPSSGIPGFMDPNTLEQLPYSELLGRCVRAPGSGLALLPLKTTFRTLSGAVSLAELLEVGILGEGTAQDLREGRLAVADVSARAEVRRYLQGTGGMAGVVLLPSNHKKSFFQAVTEHLLPLGAALQLLEAQAATCTLVDPATGRQLWLDEAVRTALIGPELYRQLLVAEQAVTGYHAPFSGTQVPLFQAMKKELVDRPLALRLLDAQLATGGLVCPPRRLRLPLEAALRFACLDKETEQCLSQTTDFLDPSTGERIGYGQLLARCVTDPETGLAFLPISGGALGEEPQGPPFIEHSTRRALSAAMATVSVGRFQGQPMSLWELLFSEAVPVAQRAALAQQHKEGALSVGELASALTTILEQAAATARTTFAGLRVPVTSGELLKAGIIDKDVYEQLERGETTAQEVGGRDSVRRYLQGTSGIAGLLLPGSQERLSIYEAGGKGLLKPDTALVLLEAQAATGFIIDPKENKRYSVEEALRTLVIGPNVFTKLLSAERAVTGYTDPYTGERISLFQAMKKDLIVRDHGIRLLEAQIATGGIIDPVHSHRLPVHVAYERGYFDEEMSRVLADPGDDTKGFFDPSTHENLTYRQLLGRCVEDPETGLRLLPLNPTQPQLVDSATRQAFQSLLLSVKYGRFQGQRVSAWELVNSEYFSEDRRRQLLQDHWLHRASLEQVARLLERDMERWADITLPTLRGRVTVHQLLEAHIIDQELLDRVLAGAVSPEALLRKDSVRKHLSGLGAVGGVLLQPSSRRLSLYQAMKQMLLGPGVALALLEAQAATGAIIDPHSLETLSVDEAVRRQLVGPELYGRLRWAEGAVTGFRDPFSGTCVSLFQAMKKGLVPVEQAICLLEAQVATGGVIDPIGHHHLPIPVATQRGCIDQEMETVLSSSSETFPTLDSRGRTSYAHLLEQCLREEGSSLHLLPLLESSPAVLTDEQVQETLQATQGTEDGTSLWELLGSWHFTEQQRRGFLEDFRVGKTTVQQLRVAVQRWVRGAELLLRARVTVPGPRGELPAIWLLDAGIITQETLEALAQGTCSTADVAEQPVVKACLWGTGCVANVLQPSGAKVSIAQAVRDGLLPVGLGHRLLEAQVGSGFLVDPLTNQRLSVEDAVKAGLVGGALTEQLQRAEQAVTGYADPDSGCCLSLWQAMEKGFVPWSEGLPLLQVQLATGGIVDPAHGVHLPQAAACRLGLLDEHTGQALTATDEDNKFFFDPNAQEKVTYQQLKEQCVLDASTGLWLLPLHEDVVFEADNHTVVALKAMKVPVCAGRFNGLTVSLWDLLHSEYISIHKRQELAALCQSGRATALKQVVSAVTALVEDSERQPSETALRGLRKQVSASDLFRSQLIDKKTLDELNQGRRTMKEVAEMDSVRQFFEGGNFIAGVLIQGTKEKMSIYQAMWKGVLRPGTALVLLEAQAATGFIIDPVRNQRLSVEEAVAAGVVGGEIQEKLLSAERAVTGYTDPYTGERISLFQAMKKGLIMRDHGIRLLEAQIATGGIIDPVHSHRLPVHVAYERGYFDEEMSRVLADPGDDTKGFFDPSTHENLTYRQLLGRCVEDPETGLYMLQIVKKGETYTCINEATRQVLQSKTLEIHVGRFAGQMVSFWDLLSSEYFTEDRKHELVQEIRAQNVNTEQLVAIITATVEETEKQNAVIKVAGIGGEVSAAELFSSGIIDKKTLDTLCREKGRGQDLSRLEHVKSYLEGRGCIAGVTTPSTHEVMSFYEASRRGLIPVGFAAQLLEAQAATGFILDPCSHQRFTVHEAVAAGLVGKELQERLLDAEKAATGYVDPATGDTLSLFQAMKRKLVEWEEGLRLLEVQVATGGIVDPLHHHRVPMDTAYRRGCLAQDMSALVSDHKCINKRFVDPNTQEKVTYQELQDRSKRAPGTGWALFPVISRGKDCPYIEEATRRALEAEWVEVTKGRYKDQRRSVWELLNTGYVTEDKKLQLAGKYRSEFRHALEHVAQIISETINEKEKNKKQLWFRGIRRQITASELFHSDIIAKSTLEELERGCRSVEELRNTEEVKRYLEGTSCIAGVLAPAKDEPGRQEKMSIYQAMWKGVLRPGTALVLLEAQAATGFVIDPVRNQRLSVEEAVAAGVVGGEIREKLLSAERAVTGYTDPYTGERISLFQAMKKDLIVRDHGIRLLEAQIATGGIIDPVHSHRLPVHVAYERGYFDEEMSRVLADPGDDTKGFFDPSTHENLTYRQLLGRCVEDPETGLYMLQLAGRDSAVHQLSEELRGALRDARVTPGSGALQGQSLSVWELLFRREVPESLRQDLLLRCQAGTLTAQGVAAALTSLAARAEDGVPLPAPPDPRGALSAATMEVKLLAQFGSGTLGLPALTRRLTAIIEEAEAAHGSERAQGHASSDPQEPGPLGRGDGDARPSAGEADAQAAGRLREQALRAATMEVHAGQFRGQRVSVWDVLFSSYLSQARRDELLAQHAAGALALPALVATLTQVIEEAEERLSKLSFRGLRRQVSASELRTSGILGPETLRDLAQGTKTPQEVTEMDSVKRYLEGTSCIAGVLAPAKDEPGRQEKMSIYQAMWKGAATGFVIDPVRNQRLSVEEAVAAGVVGGEIREKLLSAERAVTGYTDPYTGERISLFQAMKKDLIVRDHGIRLLEAQIATGGIIDPVHSHRLPVHVAYERGYFDEEMSRVLADPGDDTKGFFDPSTHENLTYRQLLGAAYVGGATREQLLAQFGSGTLGLPALTRRLTAIIEEAEAAHGSERAQGHASSDPQEPGPLGRGDGDARPSAGEADAQAAGRLREQALRAATMEVHAGQFRGQRVSVWDVLFSSYLSQARRDELLAQHAAGALALPALVATLTQVIEEAEERLSKLSFRGLRRQVSASELRTSGILGPETLRDLAQGTKTPQEVTEMDSVKRYLEGTSCIAGVLAPAKDEPGRQEKMSIYQAMWKGVLRPGTALVLLEAQAATGFVIDPVRNQRLSVEEAVAAGVVGGEIREKLLSAERAVTGYTDPYTGERISLFQAMKKDLIVRDHGIRLLEAQIATGGIIDPVHSHRLPVHVAYERGYFDEEMSRVLADPGDDTKGFFDPSTHENLTYRQLLGRCVEDPETGLYMLQLAGRDSAVHQLSEELRGALRDARVTPGSGALQGQSLSVWELLFRREVPESLRQDLLLRCQAGTLTAQGVAAALTSLAARAEDGVPLPAPPDPRGALSAATMEVKVGRLRGPAQPVWDVLASSYVGGATREQLLAQFGSGTLGLPALTRRLTAIIEEAEAAHGSERAQGHASSDPQEPGPLGRGDGDARPSAGEADAQAAGRQPAEALRAATMEVHAGQFRGQRVSVWDVLFSSYLSQARRDELLAQHAAGALALPALVATLTQVIEEAEERLSKLSFRGLRRQVSASELRTSGILGPETLRDLAQGTKTPQEDEPGRQEKMSIYQAMWKGVLRPGTALVLLERRRPPAVIDPVRNQRLSVEEAVAAGVVGGEIREKLLSAERAVTGYTDPYTGERISLFQAMKKDLIVRDHGIRLLEAQIATGGIIDPVHSHRLPVHVAYERGYFDEEMSRVLADPGDDTKGFFDPSTHENLTYRQLLGRCVEDPETGLYMLQLAGRDSAVHQLSEELRGALRDARVTPGSGALQGQSLSVWELLFRREVPESLRQDLLLRCQAGTLTAQGVAAALTSLAARAEDGVPLPAPPDPRGALSAATMEVKADRHHRGGRGGPRVRRAQGHASSDPQEPGPLGRGDGDARPSAGEADAQAAGRLREQALRAATMEVHAGQFRGQRVSVWDVLFSSYLSQARRDELLAQHAAGALALPALVATLTQVIEEAEERLSKLSFRGLRRQVSASELRTSGILGPETLRDLAQGTKTPQEVTEMDSVKRYLEGTSCIAGVLAPAKDEPGRQEKMSIYQAMWKGAATGFVIDPVRNQRLSVEEAVAAGVVGGEIREKLLSAERAVTGYTDPYTGERISLFQAMKKDLIVRDHGIRLLEAQIATGGIIDPVHSHRLPVHVAYERGYFDEEMSRVLADPGDDTKGFFDPSTHENLTYRQLLGRCVEDPETGLYMLQLAGRDSAVHQLSEELRGALRDARVTPGSGALQGQSLSVWELLFRREVPESLRQDLLLRCQAGTLTAQGVAAALTSLAARAEDGVPLPAPPDPRGALSAATMEVKVGRLRGPAQPVWDVLASSYVGGATRSSCWPSSARGRWACPR
ncbi:Epiplakin [Manis pentadactyla]|nr:Epiplakin [Manis pentadactyla]